MWSVVWNASPGALPWGRALPRAATTSSLAPAFAAARAVAVLLAAVPAAKPVAASPSSNNAAVSAAEPPAVSAAAAAATAVSATFAAGRPGLGHVERVVVQLRAAELYCCLKGGVVGELQVCEPLSR
jgi:hypothetical protein